MKTKTESVAALLAAIDQAQAEHRFDIAADMRLLQDKYVKLSKRDYQQLLAKLLEKYTVTEQAIVHAALVARCRVGDAAAIKLYFELQSDAGGNAQEVKIIDDV